MTKKNIIEESKHAKLSASGSKRWVLCAGSRKAEEGLPNQISVYAEEGKLAHKVAELLLKDQDISHLNISDEMYDYVKEYIDYVTKHYQPGYSEIFVEQKVCFSPIIPGEFWTADCIIVNEATKDLHIFDLKYGIGIKEEAKNNTQLLLYAIGALETILGITEDFMKINIKYIYFHIVQPRLNHISTWSISLNKLYEWQGYLKAKAEEAMRDDAPRIPSEAACRWCKANPTCPALYDFTVKNTMSLSNITEEQEKFILDNSKAIISFLNNLETKVYDQLINGQSFPGYKLVQGKTIRKLNHDSEEKIVELLGEKGYNKSLLGIMELERALGKEKLSELVHYTTYKPLMVKEEDKREKIELEQLSFDPV